MATRELSSSAPRRAAPVGPLLSRRTLRTAVRVLLTLAVLVVGATMILPFVWTLSASFKREPDVFAFPIQWIPKVITLQPYRQALAGYTKAWPPFWRAYVNSFIVTLPGVVGPLVTSTTAGYAFARVRFPGRDAIFLLYLAMMIVPEQVLLVPRFMLANWLSIYNTHWALIIPYLFTGYGTFLMRQACLSVPQDLLDAAKVDGAGHLRIIRNVIVPSTGPSLAALAMLLFVWRWNDYTIPLVMLSRPQLYTIPLALARFIEDYTTINYSAMMAATVLGTLPLLVVFLAANRFFVQSIVTSGLKG